MSGQHPARRPQTNPAGQSQEVAGLINLMIVVRIHIWASPFPKFFAWIFGSKSIPDLEGAAALYLHHQLAEGEPDIGP